VLGIGPAAAAECDGLLEIGARVMFRHPLVRSAVYQAASPAERREAHRALARVIDGDADADRRAWHLAEASDGPNEEVAAELERSADRAQARGGLAAAAAFLERAHWLTLDPVLRARRALAAAHAKHLAGGHDAALGLLAAAEAGPLDEVQLARADLLRAEIAYTELRGSDAPRLLLRAAGRLEPFDVRAARDTYLDALIAAHFAGRLAGSACLREAAHAARRAPPADQPATASDLLLDGLATALIDGYPAGAPLLMRAVTAFRDPAVSLREELRWLWPAAHVAMSLWEDASYEALATRHMELGRQTGLVAVLPTTLTTRIVAHAFFGQLAAADHLIAELRTLVDAMGIPMPPYGPLFVSGWRGAEDGAVAVIDAAIPEVSARGEGGALAFADYARAVLYNSLGRYDDALEAASATNVFAAEGFVIHTQGLVELIEAAAGTGATAQAAIALEQLSEMTAATGTDWGAGIRARSHALLSDDDSAEVLYREAIERLARTRVRPQLARSHLVYGEWLRRQNRSAEARDELRVSYELLSGMGVNGFAERARRELHAAGETVGHRSLETFAELTAQESHIARLAAAGYTNAEIGVQLFLSARTVEWHLRKIFSKVGVTSRRELRAAWESTGR
jgi:DNA-binding CsgD family transcriptional regulator